jgi:hypothetical protein
MPRWNAVDGLVQELGALRAATFALEREHVGAAVMAEAERIIVSAVDAIDATLDMPEDTDRLVAACEAIVAAQESIEALGATRSRAREITERSRELRGKAWRLYERLSAKTKPL